jgi:hypothetical protein
MAVPSYGKEPNKLQSTGQLDADKPKSRREKHNRRRFGVPSKYRIFETVIIPYTTRAYSSCGAAGVSRRKLS